MRWIILVWSVALLFSEYALAVESTEMDQSRLNQMAFEKCQGDYDKPRHVPIAILDPPVKGTPEEVGLVFQEELSIGAGQILNQDQFYMLPKPRAALSWVPMKVFISADRGASYVEKTWDNVEIDYSSERIQPPISIAEIPAEGRVLTELIVGHQGPSGDWPYLFDFRSNGYLRFAGYAPQAQGASLRVAANGIFGTALPDNPGHEDFPIIREVYASVKSSQAAHAFMLVESDLFCGALSVEMLDQSQESDVALIVDGHWYTRRDFSWEKSPNTGFVAYSSMHWKNERHTPERDSDEAHDSDTLRVGYAHSAEELHSIHPPGKGITVTEFNRPTDVIQYWILGNEDRNPDHYADFESALGGSNYQWRSSYSVQILESSVKTAVRLYEEETNGEYKDNIVAASTIAQDIPKAKSAEDFVRFKYKTTAFLESGD